MKKHLFLILSCVLCATTVCAQDDWISERLKDCKNGSDDWMCHRIQETYGEKTVVKKETVETIETSKGTEPAQTENVLKKTKITATLRYKPSETEAGSTLVNEFEPLEESDWVLRRVKECEAKKSDDASCSYYKKVWEEKCTGKPQTSKEQFEKGGRERLLEQQKKELEARQKAEQKARELEEAKKQAELKRQEEVERQKKVDEEQSKRLKEAQKKADEERMEREKELRQKAEGIIERRVKESKTYQKLSSGEERQKEDRILSEYYKMKLDRKNDGIQEKINWLEENQKNL